jgi:hypothetical protein
VEKLIYLIRTRPSSDPSTLREQLCSLVAGLTDAGAAHVALHVVDEFSDIPGPAPSPAGELPLRASVGFWLPAHDRRGEAEALLRPLGERCDGYLVTESVWADFGERRGAARSWETGERSPGLVTVALVHRNPLLDPRTFREFWYGHQSPVSETLQPRLRYVRNSVVHPVTPGAPPLDGIVVESWESAEVVSDIEAFHGGDPENLVVMLDSVSTVFDMTRLRSIAMSEYLY